MANTPDPNPVALSLPWGEDLQLTNNGSLVFVSGVEKVEQRIIRRFFTCPAETLADGTYVPADLIFDPNYGIGASRLVGEPIDDSLASVLQQKIMNAVLIDESVDSTQDPTVQLFAAQNGTVWANVTVYLLDGTQTSFNFPAVQSPSG
jgi:hypothetical protein